MDLVPVLLLGLFAIGTIAWIADEWKKFIDRKVSEKVLVAKQNLEKALSRQQIEFAQQKSEFEVYKQRELDLIETLKKEFSTDVLAGRCWAAQYLAEFYAQREDLIARNLLEKKRPAITASIAIKESRQQKKELFIEISLLKQKLTLYQHYFPFLVDLDEEIMCNPSDEFDQSANIDKDYDKSRNFLSREEYEKLSVTQRNQLALDRYLSGNLSKVQIGRLYERYLGWLYEKNGYSVTYNGIEQGVEDMGRDLICVKPGETIIVQAKCWSKNKTIHEKHVYQLYGTVCTYKIEHPDVKKVRGYLYVTNQLSPVARAAAQMLKIKVEEQFSLEKNFPMIKCNIGKSGEKIYHLPFDQQYNKTLIREPGEMYCFTVAEAESHGFRRARRHFTTPKKSS